MSPGWTQTLKHLIGDRPVDRFFRTPFVRRDRINDLMKSYESLMTETK